MIPMEARILFEERKEDIDKYFEFITFIINKRPSFTYTDRPSGSKLTADIDIEMSHILKANAFIILYNLVEATISNAIEDIHAQLILDPELCVDKVYENISKMALQKIDNSAIAAMDFSSGDIAKLILKTWLIEHKRLVENNKNPLFSGNVDAKTIREVAEIYGFSHQTNPDRTRNGGNLFKIKNARNSLAHGSESFSTKGRETSIDNLESLKVEVFSYLEEILNNIQNYIDGRVYLRPANNNPTSS